MKENPEKNESEGNESGTASVDTTPKPGGKKSGDTEVLQKTSLTPKQLEELKEKAAKADEHWQRLLREAADFENFKKRAAREREESAKNASEKLLQKIIPVIDNFDMALMAVSAADGGSADSIKKGVQMIHSQLKSVLAEAGLEEIDANNKAFDPNFHEAVSQKETDEVPDGHVAQQIRKGYKYRDRLLRPATVVVAKKP